MSQPTDRWHERARAFIDKLDRADRFDGRHNKKNCANTPLGCEHEHMARDLATLLSTVAAEVAAETWEETAVLAQNCETIVPQWRAGADAYRIIRDIARERARAATGAK